MFGAFFTHHKDILFFKNSAGGQGVGNSDGHGKILSGKQGARKKVDK
jgi:hypothetical protein